MVQFLSLLLTHTSHPDPKKLHAETGKHLMMGKVTLATHCYQSSVMMGLELTGVSKIENKVFCALLSYVIIQGCKQTAVVSFNDRPESEDKNMDLQRQASVNRTKQNKTKD